MSRTAHLGIQVYKLNLVKVLRANLYSSSATHPHSTGLVSYAPLSVPHDAHRAGRGARENGGGDP